MDDLDRFFIAGRWVRPQGERRLPLVDPASEAPAGSLPLASVEEVSAAVAAAASAFDPDDGGWSIAPRARRLAVLERLIALVAARRELFAQTISREIGSPIDFARFHQVDAALAHLDASLAAARATPDDRAIAPDRPADRVRREPLGVAALITPWNWPLNQSALKLGAALAAGCTMVLKPSELAPRTGLLLADCMAEALAAEGAPAGVFNLVNGDGVTGAALVADRDVAAVSFTGSTAAGRSVAAAGAQGFRRVTLELGGKSPNLLFEDCDLDLAIRQGVAHCFRNAGQSCNAASRMLVARALYPRAVALAAEAAAQTQVGPPDAPGRHLGPLVSAAQFARVQGHIADAIAEGARLVAGGPGRPEGFARGWYARPTVFADVTGAMRVAREEVFGPVLAMAPFDDEADAIAQANDTEYGLAAYVQTADPVRADRVSRRLRAGMIQVNGSSRAPGAPFGGVRASGIGREAGIWGIRAFQEIKSISGAALAEPDD